MRKTAWKTVKAPRTVTVSTDMTLLDFYWLEEVRMRVASRNFDR